ncbi:MAG: rhodanese-like domain-containing protein [Thermodesulfobacteriota bacterium]
MLKRRFMRCVPVLVFAGLLAGGAGLAPMPALAADAPAQAAQAANTLTGKVIGKSNKAKTISIEVKGTTEMVKFNDATKGLEHAEAGEAAIVEFSMQGGEKVATVVKPKLAVLPEGVTEIKVDELAKLINQGQDESNYFLIDSRPAPRYHEGHIPTAVSIPVDTFKETGAAYLPGDAMLKNTMLVFYCGGPT